MGYLNTYSFSKAVTSTIKTTLNYRILTYDDYIDVILDNVVMSYGAGLARAFKWFPEIWVNLYPDDLNPFTWSTTVTLAKGTKTKTITLNKTKRFSKTHAAETIEVFNATCYFDSVDGTKSFGKSASYTHSKAAKTSYSVSYNANGGTSTPGGQTKWYGENIALAGAISHNATSAGSYAVTLNGNGAANPAALSAARTTYWSFARWGTATSGGTTYNAGATYSGNAGLYLYAQWNTSTSTAAVKLPTPSRSGYSFVRWNTNNVNTGSGYAGGASYTPPSAITLYAIWNRTLSYNGNGATSGGVAAQTAIDTTAIAVASSNYVRPGYRFRAWNTKTDGTGTNYSPGGSYAAGQPSATLYAIWKRLPTASAPAVERCDANGRADPMGAYVSVETTWATYDDVQGQDCTIEVLAANGDVSHSRTVTLSGTSGTVSEVMGGDMNPNAAYSVRVTLKDAELDQQSFSTTLSAASGYFAPRADSVLAQRCLPDGTLDDEGTCALVTVGWSVFDGSAGTTFAPSVTGTWKDSNGDPMTDAAYTLTQALSGPVSGTTMSGTAQLLFSGLQPTSDTAVQDNKPYFTQAGERVLNPVSADIATYYESANLFSEAETYSLNVSVTDGVNSGVGGDVLTTAYYTLDALSDYYLYNRTADQAIDPAKTYFVKEGSRYRKVDDPVVEDIGDYYEANGPRPGHGISFGAPAKHEGHNVSMRQYAFENVDMPFYFFTTLAIAKASIPAEARPCIVLTTSDWLLWQLDDVISTD